MNMMRSSVIWMETKRGIVNLDHVEEILVIRDGGDGHVVRVDLGSGGSFKIFEGTEDECLVELERIKQMIKGSKDAPPHQV